MISYLGDFAEDDTVYIMFNTFSSDDPSASCTITNFINTDVHIHKDDGLTQRNNAAGITVSVDFDGITGSHMVKIDTSDNTVAGFWVVGHEYFVRIEGTTIDGATINAVVGQFSIQNRYTRGTDSAALAATALTDVTWTDAKAAFLDHAISTVDTNVDTLLTRVTAAVALASVCTEGRLAELDGANLPTDVANVKAETALIVADTNELQTDWVNGGRLDLLLDAIPTTAMRGTDNAALAATALTDATWTDAKAAFIDHSIATVDTNLDTLLTRITAARAGYLDNLSAGAVALSATALSDVTWTDAKAAFLDHSIATVDGNVDTLLTRVTAAVALASALATAQTDLDTITGADGVTLATAQALYAPNKVVPDVAGTAAGLHSTTDGLVTTVDTVVDAILVDTGTTIPGTITTLQTDSTAIKAKTDNLPDGIKKNTAITAFTFLMVDSTDHVTAKTGLTVAGNYSGDGGAVAALTNTGAITEISNGLYEIDLTAGELNYEHITLIFTASGADARVITIHTST